jgi:hypothetical protein
MMDWYELCEYVCTQSSCMFYFYFALYSIPSTHTIGKGWKVQFLVSDGHWIEWDDCENEKKVGINETSGIKAGGDEIHTKNSNSQKCNLNSPFFCCLIQIQSNTNSIQVQNSIYFHFDLLFLSLALSR